MAYPSYSRPVSSGHLHGPTRQSIQFVLVSVILWLGISIAEFAAYAELTVTEVFTLKMFDDFAQTQTSVFLLTLLLGSTVVGGVLAAIPGILTILSVSPKIEVLQRRSGMIRSVPMAFLKTLPSIVFILTQLIILSLSLGTAPQVVRSWTTRPSVLSNWSGFVYDMIFSPVAKETGLVWKNAFAGADSPQVLIVTVPSSMMAPATSFPKLRKLLGEPRPFFLDAQSASAQVYQLLSGKPALEKRFALPVLARKIALSGESPEQTEAELLPGFFDFSPELNSIRAVVDRKFAVPNLLDHRSKEVLRRRLAQSQVHMFWYFRLGLMSFLNSTWAWERISQDDTHKIRKFALSLAEQTEKSPVLFLQLSDLENLLPNVHSPFSALRWPSDLTPEERRTRANRIDAILSASLAQVRDKKNLSIFVLPYPDERKTVAFNGAFVRLPEATPTFNVSALISPDHWLTSRDIHTWSSGFLGLTKHTEFQADSELQCQTLKQDFGALTDTRNYSSDEFVSSVWRAVTENDDSLIVYPDHLAFFPTLQKDYGVLCRRFSKQAPENAEQDNAWLFRKKSPFEMEVSGRLASTRKMDPTLYSEIISYGPKQLESKVTESKQTKPKPVVKERTPPKPVYSPAFWDEQLAVDVYKLPLKTNFKMAIEPATDEEKKMLHEMAGAKLEELLKSIAQTQMN